MNETRPAAVAGLFYPARAAELAGAIERYMAEARTKRRGYRLLPTPKAIIAPHAGYVYSAPIAASAYIHVEPARDRIRRVVLVGPGHRFGFKGIGLSDADAFTTPLGSVPLDKEAIGALLSLDGISVLPQAHAEEHCLEVHLPFLQQILGEFTIVPMVVGLTSPALVAAALAKVWGGPETLIVVSSDLSHYHAHALATEFDARTARAIETMDEDAVADFGHSEGPCGKLPIAGLITVARRHELAPIRLDMRNSGDTAGSRDQVVGYGAWAFSPADKAQFTEAEGVGLIGLARESILNTFRHSSRNQSPAPLPVPLETWRACFVTLKQNGKLRGCIGSLVAQEPLGINVVHNAKAAAFEDPRFDALREHEFSDTDLSISILSPPMPLAVTSEQDLLEKLRPGIDGLILRSGSRSATFLPAVWRDLPEPAEFVAALRRKAGMEPGEWPGNMQVSRYMAQEVGAAD